MEGVDEDGFGLFGTENGTGRTVVGFFEVRGAGELVRGEDLGGGGGGGGGRGKGGGEVSLG